MIEFKSHPDGVIIPIRANAGSRRNEIGGEHDGMLKVSVTEAPENGKANKAIVALISKQLKVAKSACEIIAGHTSSRKKLLVRGVSNAALQETLRSAK